MSQLGMRFKNNHSEIIYKNQLIKCEKNKELKIKEYKEINHNQYLKELKNIINLNDLAKPHSNEWERNSFDYDLIFKEVTPIIKNKWEQVTVDSSEKGIDISNLIYRSAYKFNTQNMSIRLNLAVFLSGESYCWIFNRVDDYFNQNSVIIKLEKLENSQKIFASFGTFIIDSANNSVFKVFAKEQLLDHSKTKNTFYSDNDVSFLKVYVTDSCDDIVVAKIYLNDSQSPNVIVTNFFLPTFERGRAMIAGSGEKCLIQKFIVKNIDLKSKYKLTVSEINKFIKEEKENKDSPDEKRLTNYSRLNTNAETLSPDELVDKKDCCSIY